MTITVSEDELLIQKLRARYANQTEAQVRADLRDKYTETWNDAELLHDFEVHSFDGPTVRVIRKRDGKRGTVGYIDVPRVYFVFIAEDDSE